jgi:hypothetical protein
MTNDEQEAMIQMAKALKIAYRLLEKWERIGGKATGPMNEIREAIARYEETIS